MVCFQAGLLLSSHQVEDLCAVPDSRLQTVQSGAMAWLWSDGSSACGLNGPPQKGGYREFLGFPLAEERRLGR